jgi:hypothetical protein
MFFFSSCLQVDTFVLQKFELSLLYEMGKVNSLGSALFYWNGVYRQNVAFFLRTLAKIQISHLGWSIVWSIWLIDYYDFFSKSWWIGIDRSRLWSWICLFSIVCLPKLGNFEFA